MIPIRTGPPEPPAGRPFTREGFRPFFFGAALWAVGGMVPWLLAQAMLWPTPRPELLGMQWHAHQMVFGFAAAVVAGFLLTAVRNWTRLPTVSGAALLALFAAWATARLVMTIDLLPLAVAAAADLAFLLGLVAAVTRPIVRAGQVGLQGGIVSKVAALAAADALFFAGLFGWIAPGVRWGLHLGFYSILGLVLAIGRRILPGFIAAGVGHAVAMRNDRRVDAAALVLFAAFVVAEVFAESRLVAATCAALLALVHGYRMAGWHDRGVWSRPLLWSLYVAYGWIVAGFALIALGAVVPVRPLLALHALAVGGIALMAAGMIVRVSLAHSGRSILRIPRGASSAFGLLLVAAVARVALPLAVPRWTSTWIVVSALAWTLAFAIIGARLAPVWFGAATRAGASAMPVPRPS